MSRLLQLLDPRVKLAERQVLPVHLVKHGNEDRREAGFVQLNADALPIAPNAVNIRLGFDFKRDDVGIIYQMNVLPGMPSATSAACAAIL